jgi:chromosome partitioning protein
MEELMKTPFIIVLAHQKGGVGKSTIASNLAVELSKRCKLSILDLDMQKSLTYFNSLRKKNGLKEFNIMHADGITEVKNAINNNKDVLLIDVGGFDSDVNRIAILGADLIITPVSDSGIELVGLLSFRAILREIRKHRPDLKASILLNRVNVRAGSSLDEIFDFISNNQEFDKLSTILRDRADYKRAFDSGKSVIEYNGKAIEEMENLIKEITNGKN